MNTAPDQPNQAARQPDPWWGYLGLLVAFTAYGLSYDVTSPLAHALLITAFFAILFVPYVVQRVRFGRWTAPSWRAQRFDLTLILVMLALIAALLTIGFGGPRVLTALGTPLPHTLSWLSVGLILFAGIPLNRWSIKRSEHQLGS